MNSRHPFYDVNPKHLDCGDLVDTETGEIVRPAMAGEASRSLRAQRHGGTLRGVISTTDGGDPFLARVNPPIDMTRAEWRLAVALKLRAERRLFGLRGRCW